MRYFPLFADLRGRRVLVVGGGEVAERKVRLLVEAGADVQVVAPELSPWLASRDALVSDRWIATRFDPSQLRGRGAGRRRDERRGVNAQVSEAARAANVFANVVDDAERSSVIVPAIVDRSPLVIAISSGGVAPVLARLVRERIEVLIDGSFGALAAMLERWRSRIKAALAGRFPSSSLLRVAGARRRCAQRPRRP